MPTPASLGQQLSPKTGAAANEAKARPDPQHQHHQGHAFTRSTPLVIHPRLRLCVRSLFKVFFVAFAIHSVSLQGLASSLARAQGHSRACNSERRPFHLSTKHSTVIDKGDLLAVAAISPPFSGLSLFLSFGRSAVEETGEFAQV